jgi:hypothetical protein
MEAPPKKGDDDTLACDRVATVALWRLLDKVEGG